MLQELLLLPAASEKLQWAYVGGVACSNTLLITRAGAQRTHRRHASDAAHNAAPSGGARFVCRSQQTVQHAMLQQPVLASVSAALVQPHHHQQQQQPHLLITAAAPPMPKPWAAQPARHSDRQQPRPKQEQQASEREQAKQEQVNFLSLRLLLAGAMSAVVSRTCVAPLERVKMELMLRQGAKGGAWATAVQVFTHEGLRGFWKGNAINLLRTAPFKAVNFTAFDTLHRLLVACTCMDGNRERFVAGAMAGVTATLVCFPLDVVRTRLMSRMVGSPNYGPGPFRTLAGIVRHEGPAALYSGVAPAVLGMAPAGAVFYGVYDLLKCRHLQLLHDKQLQQQQRQEQGAPVLAPGLSAEQQRQGDGGADPGLLVSSASPLLLDAEGAVDLDASSSGVGSSDKVVHQQQLQEQQQQYRTPALVQRKQPPQVQAQAAQQQQRLPTPYTLLYGAAAGACSELLVFPLEVIRRRMQMQAMAAAAAAAMRTAAAAAPPGAPAAAAMGSVLGSSSGALAAGAGGVVAAASSAAAAAARAQQSAVGVAGLEAQAVAARGLGRVLAAGMAVWRVDGLRGFYTGLAPNMLQVLPSAALSYWTYETVKALLGVP